MKKQHFSLFLLIFLGFNSISQNLVPNPGFEMETSCPANNTYSAANWYSPGAGSPDYFHPCGSGWATPGNFVFGSQVANSGDALSGVGWYAFGASGWYEYVQVQLSSTLVAGEQYEISMWVSLADGVRKASDDMGIYISSSAISQSGFGAITSVTPQIKFIDGVFVTQTTWQEISGTYTATGGEEFITIGCFEPWTTTGKLDLNAAGNDRCYYFLDDVSVQLASNLPVELVSFDAQAINERNVQLQWKTISEINSCLFQIERSINGENFEFIHTVDAARMSNSAMNYDYLDSNCPSGTIYYRLKQIDCDGKFSYSSVIAVQNKILKEIQIYPNPVSNILTISFDKTSQKPSKIALFNSAGEKCFYRVWKKLSEKEISLSLSDLPKGVYTLAISNDLSLPITKKITKL